MTEAANLRRELVAVKESRAKALDILYNEINVLRKALEEAQELAARTQSYDSADLREQVARLKRELEVIRRERELDQRRAADAEAQLAKVREELANVQRASEAAMSHEPIATTSTRPGSAPSSKPSQEASQAGRDIKARYEALVSEHEAMKAVHEEERDQWRHFKAWWKRDRAAAKLAGLARSSRKPPFVKSPRAPLATKSPSRSFSKTSLPLSASPPRQVTVAESPNSLRTARFSGLEAPVQQASAGVASLALAPAPVRSPAPPSCGSSGQRSRRALIPDSDPPLPASTPDQPRARKRRRIDSETPTTPQPGVNQRQEGEDFAGQNFMRQIHRQRKATVLADPSKFKLRTPVSAEAKRTINADYEIDPVRNKGEKYPFNEVVRRKEERKHLRAADCECCREYYALANQGDDGRIKIHRHAVSRHRAEWTAPASPPGYWQMGFPNTQQIADFNRQGEEMAREKRERIEAELAVEDSRYVRRQR